MFEILLTSTTDGKVYYLGNDIFAPAETKDFTAVVNSKKDSVVVITTDSLVIGESVVISATVNGASSNAVKYFINGIETNTISSVEAITYNVVAVFEGNSTHKTNSTTKTFTVKSDSMVKEDSVVVITTDSLVIGESVVISATVNGASSNAVKYFINGIETNTISRVEAITYNVVAVFEGNNTHKTNSTNKTYVVSKKDPSINISIDNKEGLVAIAYSKLTITVADGDASGFVLIEGLDTVLYKELENGAYILDHLVLSAGEYNITVTYMGDDKYNKISDNIEFNVSKGSATPEITSIVTPINAGNDVSFIVGVVSDSANGADGTVDVYVDGVFNQSVSLDKDYNNASVTIKGLSNGTHTIGVKYHGNDNFKESDVVTVDVAVNKITPAISIVVEDDYLEAIAATYVIITVGNGDASGNIVIEGYDGEFTLVGGAYRLQMYDLVAGTYTVNVTYQGDDKYSSATKSISFAVVKSESYPVISTIKDSINMGDDLTFIVSMDSDSANGNVTVYVDGVFNQTVILDNDYANASVVIKGLGKGTHTIGVKYNGNDNYNVSLVVNKTVVVNGKEVNPDTAFSNPDSSNPETFAIEMPSDATGNFTVLVDGKKYASASLVDGKANIAVSGLSSGSHSIELVYSGDDNYSGMGKTQTMVVVKGNSTPAGPVSPGNPDSVFGLPNGTSNPPVFSINLPTGASGNFTVSIGDKNYTASVVDGKANITVTGLSGGSYPIVVGYSGDNYYGGLFKAATIKLDSAPAPAPVPVPSSVPKVVKKVSAFKFLKVKKNKITFKKKARKNTKTIKVNLLSGNTKLSGKKVFFKVDKKLLKKIKAKKGKKVKKAKKILKQLKKGIYAVKTKKGVAKLTLKKSLFTFKKCSGKLTATFRGDNVYLKSSKKVTVVIK